MILKGSEEKVEEKKEELNEEEEIKVIDIVGKKSMDGHDPSVTVGPELEALAGKLDLKTEHVLVKEQKDTEKLSEELTMGNLKREEQKLHNPPSKISDIEVINSDPMLKPFEKDLQARINLFNDWINKFDKNEGGIVEFANSYKKFGLNVVKGGIQYREWAPGAHKVWLTGDFNGWNRSSHECKRNEFGVWELFLPDKEDGTPAIPHGSKVKAALILANGKHEDRIPAWMRYVVQNKDSVNYDGIFWNPPTPYKWKHEEVIEVPKLHLIYECHVGMSSWEGKINTYVDFYGNKHFTLQKYDYLCLRVQY